MQMEMLLPPAGREPLCRPMPVEAGERLYREFLAGRSPNTLNAYDQDLAAFAASQGAGSPGEALEALIGLRPGRATAAFWRGVQPCRRPDGASHDRPPAAVLCARLCASPARLAPPTWVPEIKRAQGADLPRHARTRS